MPQPLMSKKLKLNNSMRTCKNKDLLDLLELTPKKDDLFIIGDWNAKLGRQEKPGVWVSKFSLWVQNKASLALRYRIKQGKG